jgi:hypothetical protein
MQVFFSYREKFFNIKKTRKQKTKKVSVHNVHIK